MKCQSIFSYSKISFFKPEIPQQYLLFSFRELGTLPNVSCIGTGLQNLRECILWTQTKHDFEPKKKRPFWKQMSKNFIERYVYLIVFTTYVKAFSHRDFDKSFTHWVDERAELRTVIANGVKNFNWI